MTAPTLDPMAAILQQEQEQREQLLKDIRGGIKPEASVSAATLRTHLADLDRHDTMVMQRLAQAHAEREQTIADGVTTDHVDSRIRTHESHLEQFRALRPRLTQRIVYVDTGELRAQGDRHLAELQRITEAQTARRLRAAAIRSELDQLRQAAREDEAAAAPLLRALQENGRHAEAEPHRHTTVGPA